MARLLLMLSLLCLGHQGFAAEENWNSFSAAKKTWLLANGQPNDEVISSYSDLPNFVDINYYLLNQFFRNGVNGWRIGKMLNYSLGGMPTPSVYKTMQVAQRPLRQERVPVSVYYFVEQNGNPARRLAVVPYADYLLFYSAGKAIESETSLGKEFVQQFLAYAKQNNPFRGAVIEYMGGFRFLDGAERLNATWDQMILDESLKKDLIKGIDGFLQNYDYPTWKKLGLPLSQGVLLTGLPGTGKSLVAKIISTSVLEKKYKSQFTYIHIQANNIYGSDAIKEIYDMARYFGNAVVYFEDIDLVAGTNRFNRPAIKNELMQQLSGIEKLEGVLTVGTTNYGADIDPALKRSQRLGLHYNFDSLLLPERRKLVDIFFKNKSVSDLNLDLIAVNTERFTGADLQALMQISFDEAFKRTQKEGGELTQVKITQADAELGLKLFKKMKFKVLEPKP